MVIPTELQPPGCRRWGLLCYTAAFRSGVVQLAAHQTLDLVILVRVQAPEPDFLWGRPSQRLGLEPDTLPSQPSTLQRCAKSTQLCGNDQPPAAR